MERRKFIAFTSGSILLAGSGYYLLSDKSNFVRNDIKTNQLEKISYKPHEKEILYLASLAPSGHNTQPWLVKYIEPYHWIICNDKSKWLPAVDPTQRETILSIGTFLQNLEYAANHYGYNCQFNITAISNQDENLVNVKLIKAGNSTNYDIQKIRMRLTVRSDYLNDVLRQVDQTYLLQGEPDFIHFFPKTSKDFLFINEHTIEANRIQSYRDRAQDELSDWIRFNSKDAEKHLRWVNYGQYGNKRYSSLVFKKFL